MKYIYNIFKYILFGVALIWELVQFKDIKVGEKYE